jgi:putative membrane protein
MLLELLLALALGIICGSITGLAPGIHINLVSAGVLALSSFLLIHSITPIAIVVFLVAMAITHTFVDFIPSIFLGAPDEDDTALSILPGHEMLTQGKAYEAVIYTLYGSITALLIILFFSPIFYFYLPQIYPYAQRIMPFILIVASIFLIYFEKSSRFWAFIIFSLAGILGLATLTLPLKESLLPLFTGLFGISSLITSISKKQKLPKQEIPKLKKIKIEKSSFFKSIFASVIASPLCSFLPGMGSGQAAVIGSEVLGDDEKSKLNRKSFLILLGAINTIVTGLSFITLYSIGKARTGIAVAVGKVIELNLNTVIAITITILISGIISFFLTIYLAKLFTKLINKLNYKILSICIIFFLIAINFIFSDWLGILVVLISTFLGLSCIYLGIRRTHLMGCLIISAIVLTF